MLKQNSIPDMRAKISPESSANPPKPAGVVPSSSVSFVCHVYECVIGALLPTYSQQGLVVVDVFGGKRWTHADGKWWQRQTRQQAGQQELQLDLWLGG